MSSGKLVTWWGVGLGDLVPEHPPPSRGAGCGRGPPGAGRRRQLPFLPLEATGERAGWGAALKLGDPATQRCRGRARPDPKSSRHPGAPRTPSGAHRLPSGGASAPTLPLHAASPAQSMHGGPEGTGAEGDPGRWGGARRGWGHGRRGAPRSNSAALSASASLALSTPPLHPPARSGPSSAQLGPMLHPFCEAPRNPALPLASPAWLRPASSPGQGKQGRGPPQA